jgi:hypothetical protein
MTVFSNAGAVTVAAYFPLLPLPAGGAFLKRRKVRRRGLSIIHNSLLFASVFFLF